jgi:hypothetical protein
VAMRAENFYRQGTRKGWQEAVYLST